MWVRHSDDRSNLSVPLLLQINLSIPIKVFIISILFFLEPPLICFFLPIASSIRMYLGKPVFMVPVEGHYEQYCNSRDAFKAGAGLYDKSFKITRFLITSQTIVITQIILGIG